MSKDKKARIPEDDDGYELTLHTAKQACSALFALLIFFWLTAAVLLIVPQPAHEEPLLTGVMVALALSIVTAAPFVREWMVRRTIGENLETPLEKRQPRRVYAMFSNATAVGVLIAQAPALCGFVLSAMVRFEPVWLTLLPLAIGTVITCAAWMALWPNRRLWDRWTWQAKLRREVAPIDVFDLDVDAAGVTLSEPVRIERDPPADPADAPTPAG